MVSHLSSLGRTCSVSQCSFDYLSKSDVYEKEKPYYFSGRVDSSQKSSRTNLQYVTHENISIRDVRGLVDQLTLERDGFVLLRHEPSIKLDHTTDGQIHAYLDEVTVFIKEKLSAEAVFCYNYQVCREVIQYCVSMLVYYTLCGAEPATVSHADRKFTQQFKQWH